MKQLIPISYLNEACFLSLNTNEKKYFMCLKIAQDRLEDVLGPEFFEEIIDQFPDTFTADNETLYEDYIKDYLAWQTYHIYLKFADTDPTPTGIRQFNDDNSSLLSDIQRNAFEKNILNQANDYKYKMINYIKLEKSKDTTKFPLFDDCKEYNSFSITSVDKKSDALFQVQKSITTNE